MKSQIGSVLNPTPGVVGPQMHLDPHVPRGGLPLPFHIIEGPGLILGVPEATHGVMTDQRTVCKMKDDEFPAPVDLVDPLARYKRYRSSRSLPEILSTRDLNLVDPLSDLLLKPGHHQIYFGQLRHPLALNPACHGTWRNVFRSGSRYARKNPSLQPHQM